MKQIFMGFLNWSVHRSDSDDDFQIQNRILLDIQADDFGFIQFDIINQI